jgi:hypothetical protein
MTATRRSTGGGRRRLVDAGAVRLGEDATGTIVRTQTAGAPMLAGR